MVVVWWDSANWEGLPCIKLLTVNTLDIVFIISPSFFHLFHSFLFLLTHINSLLMYVSALSVYYSHSSCLINRPQRVK